MITRKIILSLLVVSLSASFVAAQDRDEEEKRPFKTNLFTGGSVSLAFYSNTFLIGGSPVLGYSLTNWADAGIVLNYNYTSYRDVYLFDDRLRQTVYGGGGFVKLYPVRFLFAQAQLEHNFIRQKYMPNNGGLSTTEKSDVSSFLIGGGYTTGRFGRGGTPHFYLSVLFDVMGD